MLENMAAPQLENHIEGVPAGLDDASKFLQASCGAVGAFMDRVHVALAQHIQCASTWVEADAEKFQVEATCIDPLTAAAGTRLLFDGVGDGVNAVALELSEIGDEIKAYLEANFDGQPAVTASAGVSSAPGP
ncbi:hypothetical protein V5F40_22635 [Xanthobacter sp. DSM 14520]|uniref:hypothetical protein n=1 Tax=Xanthobacter autotrophicus (strain ATCC BAA-1158 / Py2) TaxID=78245 RepID=UPI0037271641